MVAEEAAEKVQELGHREARIERHALELDADPLLDRLRVTADVQAEDLHGAGIGGAQTLEDLDRGRLAGAVRPEHPEDLAPPDLEGDSVDGFDVAVVLLQVGDANDRRVALRHRTSLPLPADTAPCGAHSGAEFARISRAHVTRPGATLGRLETALETTATEGDARLAREAAAAKPGPSV